MELIEIKGDLFSAESNIVLAHCISQDVKMGAGIAAAFVKHYPETKKSLITEDRQIGDAIRTESDEGVVIYHLITKQRYFHKPTYQTMTSSLEDLKNKMIANGEKYLAIPKLGSGLDKLDWSKVKTIIENVFEDSPIHITVYVL